MGNRGATWAAVLLVLALGAAGALWASRRGAADPAAKLQDPNPAVRVAAIRDSPGALSDDLLIAALKDEDADVRLVAARRLRGQGKKSVRALIAALGDPHAGARRQAAESLCWIGAPAVPQLCGALKDADPHVRAEAALALSDVARWKDARKRDQAELDTVVPLLRSLLKDEDAEVRRNAEIALKDLGWQTPRHVGQGEEP
jgi:HEAT repeat protein